MKTTTLSLRSIPLAALLMASPVAGMINFTFDENTVPLKAGTTVSDDDNIDFGTSGDFSITVSGLTMTVSMSGDDPELNSTGIFLKPNESPREDVLVMTFDQPVTIDSVTVGRFQFSSSSTMKVSVGGPGGVGLTGITFDSPAATTYQMPSTISDVELTPGVNDFSVNGNLESFIDISEVTVSVVPEPESAGILLGVAGLAFVFARRRLS